MINNYIRLGYASECHFIFFDANDPESVESASNKLQRLRQLPLKGPRAIWIPHPKFRDVDPIGK